MTTMANPCNISDDLVKYILKEVSFEICNNFFEWTHIIVFNYMFYI